MAGARSENLIRAMGVRQLTASIVNSTIGAGIFVVPALVAQGLGAAAPMAYLICAVMMVLVVTTFAMAASRVSATGGLFAYVETAFGPYIGFLAGTLQWVSSMTAAGGVSIAFLDALAAAVPALHDTPARLVTSAVLLTVFATINSRGVSAGARTIELMTLGKLLPLLVFVSAGAWSVNPAALTWSGPPDADALRRAVLLLSFAFIGIENALTPSGEIKRPAASIPRAIYLALATTTTLYIAIQVVAQGVLGADLATHTEAPLADATQRFLGTWGATLVFAGTLISMLGYLSGDALSSPRNLYAFGRDGFIPAAFARVHPVCRAPRLAIWTHAVLVFAIANSGRFETVVIVSNVATFTLYCLACLAAMALMRRDVRTEDPPFVVPGGTLIAVASLAAVLFVMSSATWKEFAATGLTLLMASMLFLIRRRTAAAAVARV